MWSVVDLQDTKTLLSNKDKKKKKKIFSFNLMGIVGPEMLFSWYTLHTVHNGRNLNHFLLIREIWSM